MREAFYKKLYIFFIFFVLQNTKEFFVNFFLMLILFQSKLSSGLAYQNWLNKKQFYIENIKFWLHLSEKRMYEKCDTIYIVLLFLTSAGVRSLYSIVLIFRMFFLLSRFFTPIHLTPLSFHPDFFSLSIK